MNIYNHGPPKLTVKRKVNFAWGEVTEGSLYVELQASIHLPTTISQKTKRGDDGGPQVERGRAHANWICSLQTLRSEE